MKTAKRKDFECDLKHSIRGNISFDDISLGIYATDASIYQLFPVALVEPVDEEDVCRAVQTASKYGISILPRGGGTSLNGQACGHSMIIDFTKHMNRILGTDVEARKVRVQPGIVLDVLNAELQKHGLMFAPDPATSSRATIGGMMGNNSAGTKSIIYGMTRDHVLECKVLLSDGTVMNFSELSSSEYEKKEHGADGNAREAELYRGFRHIIESNRSDIKKSFPNVMRRVQGYAFDAFTGTDRWNLCKLMIGSEGTLGLILECTLSLEPLPKSKALCTVHFSDLLEAVKTVSPILEYKPSAVEILDEDLVTRARKNLSIKPLTEFIRGDPKAILVVEFFAPSLEEATKKAEKLAVDLKNKKLGYAWPIITEPSAQAKVWAVRKNGLGLILGMKGDKKPLPIIEDCAIPVDVLPEYIDRVLRYCKERGVSAAMYAHASVGVIHVRPILNLKIQEDIDNMKAIAGYAFGLVKEYGGALSGEHGDGRVRSPFLEMFVGSKVYNAFRETKKLFDPDGLMNPGVIVDPNPMDQDLRYGTTYKTPQNPSIYNYREDGSFAQAVEMCTGIGDCRQLLAGTMCPSFRATLDEEYSTRGYANALRLAMTGQLTLDATTSSRLYRLLGFCLSCKSCKSECPSNVDLARLKSEFLQRYYDTHRVPLRKKLIKRSVRIASLLSGPPAGFANAVIKSRLFKKLLEAFAGFDKRRSFPQFARIPFKKWFVTRFGPRHSSTGKVALFCDTVTNFYQTDIGKSAVELLESCGYKVVLADAGCCQRPKITQGFLREAKREGEKTLRNLDRFIEQGLKIVVCEPSCCSTLVDDLPALIDDEDLGTRIKDNVMMIDIFLAKEVQAGNLTCGFTSPFKNIVLQGHCHQKALFGTGSMKYLLDRVQGTSARELDSGCCGMAEEWGFEKEHYELSMKIGEDRLFPEIRKCGEGTCVVACGYGCRIQIEAGTGIRAVHWVDAIRGVNRTHN
jgi:FAD/FMN-containing dehydrogenase/Fe-S oxidoreductase